MNTGTNEQGQIVIRRDACSLNAARRVAAMLDIYPDQVRDQQPLPAGWHFFLLAGDTRRAQLREDGFPGLGVRMPDLGLPRLLLAGRRTEFPGEIRIGAHVERSSEIADITEKEGRNGRMALMKVRHALRETGQTEDAIIETQTYALMDATPESTPKQRAAEKITGDHIHRMTPDEILLFQYSALGFNSHKIHIDRSYAQETEGLPDLVVNGGLTALLVLEFLRTELGLRPTTFNARHLAPLYCNREITFAATELSKGWKIRVFDDAQRPAAEMEVDAA